MSRDPLLPAILDRYAGNGAGGVTLADVETVFTRWYQLRDLEPIHVTLGAIMANRLDSDPLWLFLVAPPGSLKTEIIRALSGIDSVYPLSNLTAQTFASGYQTKGEEPSLLLLTFDYVMDTRLTSTAGPMRGCRTTRVAENHGPDGTAAVGGHPIDEGVPVRHWPSHA
jgi:hypothetical protein